MQSPDNKRYFRHPSELLTRDHTLNGSILFGLDGYIIEIQARAMQVLRSPDTWRNAVSISGMARGSVHEALDRISGAFAKLVIPLPHVEILVVHSGIGDQDLGESWVPCFRTRKHGFEYESMAPVASQGRNLARSALGNHPAPGGRSASRSS